MTQTATVSTPHQDGVGAQPPTPGPLGRLRADGRLVVSVDEHGAVSSSPAEPRRW